MPLIRSIKRQARMAAPAVIFAALAGYFVWNASRGDLGLHAYTRRGVDLAAANRSLADAQAERDGWEQRVAALQPAHLDKDALDERARAMLNLAAPDEVVVPTAKSNPGNN